MLHPVPVSRVVDLLDPSLNRIGSMDIEEARRRVLSGDPAAVRAIDGSFALVAVDPVDSTKIRLARSMDRPMRYFLAKRREGPALFVADRIDTLRDGLAAEGLDGQFHPSYTRMVPAHYVVDLALIGCPDPDPVYTRFFTPSARHASPDLDEIGARYIGALADETAKWLRDIDADSKRGQRRRGALLVLAMRRSASRFPAASTADRCSSSSITRCCGWGCRPRG